jgi:hypothetical protein
MGAPTGSITPDNMTMELTRCVGNGITLARPDDSEDEDITEQQQQPSLMLIHEKEKEIPGIQLNEITAPTLPLLETNMEIDKQPTNVPSTPLPPQQSQQQQQLTPIHYEIGEGSETGSIHSPFVEPMSTAVQVPVASKEEIPMNSRPSLPMNPISLSETNAVSESPRPLPSAFTTTPHSHRAAARFKETLRMGTPGRLTPARPRKVGLRSPRTLDQRPRTSTNAQVRSDITRRLSVSRLFRASFGIPSNDRSCK